MVDANAWTPATPEDLARIEQQLGRPPRPVLAVAARCRFGWPQVVVTEPLGPTPFPTTFWLTCPYLAAATSRLEGQGWIGRLGRQAAVDPEFSEQLHRAHVEAAMTRWWLADPEALRQLEGRSPAQAAVIRHSGVGGVRRDGAGIKCLHAHLADGMGRGGAGANPVAREVMETLARDGVDLRGSPECASGCVAGAAAVDANGLRTSAGERPLDLPSSAAPANPVEGPKASPRGEAWPRVAVVDIGTNSVRLLVVQAIESPGGGDRHWVPLMARLRTTRLGEGLGETASGEPHRLRPQAIERTVEAVAAFVEQARRAGCERDRIRVIATSAARDAANGDALAGAVWSRCGLEVGILPGETESRLSFAGAVAGLAAIGAVTRSQTSQTSQTGTVAVIDVGGGSTEVALGAWNGQLWKAMSAPVGAVRLTERLAKAGAAGQLEVLPALQETARQAVSPMMEQIRALAGTGPLTTVAVGGTATTLAAVDQRLDRYDSTRVHGYRMAAGRLDDLLGLLASLSLEDRRRLAGMDPKRADIIVAGAACLQAVVRALGASELVISESDLLLGAAVDRDFGGAVQ